MCVTKNFTMGPLAVLFTAIFSSGAGAETTGETDSEDVMVVKATAEEELKQQPGVSIITADDIKKEPPVNDLSDIIRKMPGVNLTGNSASGSRGNNRQIDIRG